MRDEAISAKYACASEARLLRFARNDAESLYGRFISVAGVANTSRFATTMVPAVK